MNKRSEVDESLFGNPHHVETRNAMLKARWDSQKVAGNDDQIMITRGGRQATSASSSACRNNGPETVDVITKDLIRTLMYAIERQQNYRRNDYNSYYSLSYFS